MQLLSLIRGRLSDALTAFAPDSLDLAEMVRPTQDVKHGDFQINCAMPLGKRLGQPPRNVATQLLTHLQLDDLCLPAEVAGPGFINLKLRDDWICNSVSAVLASERLGVDLALAPQRYVIDYSSPNIAKPMHVGHVRSTVIGNSLAKILSFLGHQVITDNHLGDWGTQFGMIIYGYRNFLDPKTFKQQPVAELLRIYRIVNSLIDYHKSVSSIAKLQDDFAAAQLELDRQRATIANLSEAEAKKASKGLALAEKRWRSIDEQLQTIQDKIDSIRSDAPLYKLASEHADIGNSVLEETAKLHAGDAENVKLWNDLLPYCMDEINRVYERLNVTFDHVLGESFYHSMLPAIVEKLHTLGLATASEGAICVFLDGFDAPMIVQKQDGAFLYATTDLATIQYRVENFQPDTIVYVVDFRQGDHFQKLFAVAPKMGFEKVRLEHVSFGTVLDESGRPLKTRSGALTGLVSLLDEAVDKAFQVVCNSEAGSRLDPPLSDEEKKVIAETVGIGAIKYADLAHHRTSDYKFSLEKMVSMDGNTAAYVQYAYARIQGVLRSAITAGYSTDFSDIEVQCSDEAERSLMLSLLRYEEVLQQVQLEFAPNLLVDYLYEIAKGLAAFYERCPIIKADSDDIRSSRLALITLSGRLLKHGLSLLGIDVVPRM